MADSASTAASVVQSLERERKYLAEALHDGLCQNLCGISIQLKVFERRLVPDAPHWKDEFVALRQTLEESIDQARFLYRTLYPPIKDGASMAQAIGEFAQSNGASLECDEWFFSDAGKIDPLQGVMFFRIAQEILRAIAVKQSAGALIFLRREDGFIKMRIVVKLGDPQFFLDPLCLEVARLHANQIGADVKVSLEEGEMVIECVSAVSK
jgi:signal transduction histidine kinase